MQLMAFPILCIGFRVGIPGITLLNPLYSKPLTTSFLSQLIFQPGTPGLLFLQIFPDQTIALHNP
jgi:hypothetical protein